MKKYIYLLIIFSVLALSACKKKEEMPDYIPTQSSDNDITTGNDEADIGDAVDNPEDEDIADNDITDETLPGDEDGEPTQPAVIGKTTVMYVKLNQYGGFLNVRPTPATTGTPVGFLVHAEAVEVIEIKDGWASILYNDKVCYVKDDYIVEKKPAYLEPPTATPKPTAAPDQTPEAVTEAASDDI